MIVKRQNKKNPSGVDTFTRHLFCLPAGYVLNMDSIMSAVKLYLKPLQPSVCGLMSACRAKTVQQFFFLYTQNCHKEA